MRTALLNREAFKIPLSTNLLEALVQSIVDVVPVKSIYIFGSYARGEQRKDSDLDIYVVTKDGNKKASEYGFLAYKSLRKSLGYEQSYDIISSPADVFESKAKQFWNIEYVISREGVKIYG